MKTKSVLIVSAIMFLFASCAKDNTEPQSNRAVYQEADNQRGSENHFVVHLSGDQENPPVMTDATGQGIFHLRNNGTELHYRLIVANIENVTMAHIHMAPADSNGAVVAWLYPSSPPSQLISGMVNGVLAQGVITSGDLVGPLDGMSISDLMDVIRDHNAYINVHTSQFGSGEIRGQF